MYTADWESLEQRPLPAWFDEVKFGIFIHWGVYSVPAYAPRRSEVDSTGGAYSEWYGWNYLQDTSYRKFHQRVYSSMKTYQDFASEFKAQLFDPNKWAEIIEDSGAKYTAIVSKHHDGYCLWPSEYAHNWNTVDIGPHRDVLGELKAALDKTSVRFGVYYSLYEWTRPSCNKERIEEYAVNHMIPQLKELITKYQPWMLFTDGEWDYTDEEFHSKDFLAWLYNESPVKDTIVTNDRWGKGTRSKHGMYYTTEYGEVYGGEELSADNTKKWEECRGIGASFGYNRNENLEDYLSRKDLLQMFIDIVSKGGNFILNIGPADDGTIPVIMQDRLHYMGEWLRINGDAIYGTSKAPIEAQEDIRYTVKGDKLYAIVTGGFRHELTLKGIKVTSAEIIGNTAKVAVENTADGAKLTLTNVDYNAINMDAWVIALSGVEYK